MPSYAHMPAEFLNNADLAESVRPGIIERKKLDPNWWLAARAEAIESSQRHYEPDEEERAHAAMMSGQTQPVEKSHAH